MCLVCVCRFHSITNGASPHLSLVPRMSKSPLWQQRSIASSSTWVASCLCSGQWPFIGCRCAEVGQTTTWLDAWYIGAVVQQLLNPCNIGSGCSWYPMCGGEAHFWLVTSFLPDPLPYMAPIFRTTCVFPSDVHLSPERLWAALGYGIMVVPSSYMTPRWLMEALTMATVFVVPSLS